MKVERKTVFCVWDCEEGKVHHFCETKTTADRLIKIQRQMGRYNCKVTESVGYVIDGELYVTGVRIELPSEEDKELDAFNVAKEAILAKAKSLGMTDEDIQDLIRFTK